jgi:hypothetical protein
VKTLLKFRQIEKNYGIGFGMHKFKITYKSQQSEPDEGSLDEGCPDEGSSSPFLLP